MPMGENTTNFSSDNIDELLTSYIDNEIKDPQSVKFIEEKLKTSESLTKKYKSELLTRNSYRERLKAADVPQNTIMKVNAAIDKLIEDARKKHSSKPEVQTAESGTTFLQYFKNIISIPVNIGRLSVQSY